MFVAAHEWTSPREPAASPALLHDWQLAPHKDKSRELYGSLSGVRVDEAARARAGVFLQDALQQVQPDDCELPESPHDLLAWMHNSAQLAGANYRAYLERRKAGEPRRYFQNRAHALYFLRQVAPTKLVDGAWLYGVLAHWQNPRFSHLIATYVEELGEGQADKNHVFLYRKLLENHGLALNPGADLLDGSYTQGAVQLALGCNAADFLPEIIGFNLGYEQLPLHLLITSFELNELGIDPYYFTLHVTVDNADTGHARRAVQAVLDNLPPGAGRDDFWRRVRNGCKLSNSGIGTTRVISGFEIEQEVVTIFSRKSVTGHGAHSDYCRVAGRSINDWLAQPSHIPGFMAALEQTGWIRRGAPVQQSRFWALLQGERAEMFGVFSPYELQVIHDWIRGDASADGQAYDEPVLAAGKRRATFRAASRRAQFQAGLPNAGACHEVSDIVPDVLDTDLRDLQMRLAAADNLAQKKNLLIEAMSPSRHWTPAGLYATRQFVR